MNQYKKFEQKDLKVVSKRYGKVNDHKHHFVASDLLDVILDRDFGKAKDIDRPRLSFGCGTPYPSTPRSERQYNG